MQLFSNKSSKKTGDILKKYAIIKPYILYVGNAYPHKNLEKLIKVFYRFRKNNFTFSLVLAGGKDYFYKRLEKGAEKMTNLFSEKTKGRIIFPGFIEESDLAAVYKESEMVVFPSLYEGFGFPPLEALIHRKKVACSNQTSMPEVLGKTVNYFDPENEESMLNCLARVAKARNILSEKEIKEKLKNLVGQKLLRIL